MKYALLALSTAFPMAAVFGQTPAQPLQFEAASIKPSAARGGGTHSNSTPGALNLRNYTLVALVAEAYCLKDYQVSGGPKWTNADRYDISAKAAGPADDRELYRMLQTLLAQRFQLTVHRESKPYPGYALVAGKKGLKIKPVEDHGDSSSSSHGGPVTFKEMSMERLAAWVARQLNAPVLDATGVPGVFSFTLEWTPENRLAAAPAPANGVASDPTPTILAALEEQLGVRAEPRKVPVDVIVIDRAEKATEN